MDPLMIAVVAGLAGMLGWGFADFFAKKTIDVVGDVASLAWAGLFGTIFLGALALWGMFTHDFVLTIPARPALWILLAFFGALQAAVYLSAYNGFGKGQVAVLTPIFASFAGLTALISIVFLGEPISSWRLIALIIIFAGIMAMSIDPVGLRGHRITLTRTPGLFEVGIATILAAAWTLLWNQFVSGQDWLSYAMYMFLFMTIAVFVAAWIFGKPVAVHFRSMWKFLILIGLCEIVAYVGISWGYGATTETSVVAMLSGAFALPTIILARIFLGERPNWVQNFGSILIIGGLIVLPLV